MFDEQSQSRNNCLIFSKYLNNMFVAVNFLLKYNMHSKMSSAWYFSWNEHISCVSVWIKKQNDQLTDYSALPTPPQITIMMVAALAAWGFDRYRGIWYALFCAWTLLTNNLFVKTKFWTWHWGRWRRKKGRCFGLKVSRPGVRQMQASSRSKEWKKDPEMHRY